MIFTIGHSTRPLAVFLDLLHAHGIRRLADVRTVPRSKRHPHFGGEALEQSWRRRGSNTGTFPVWAG